MEFIQRHIKKQIYILFCIVQLAFCTAWGQETVTFNGEITRHEAVNLNVEVKGIVYFNITNESVPATIETPFTIPAGQRSTIYEQTLDWPNDNYSYISVSLTCTNNCDQANARDFLAYALEEGKTGTPGGVNNSVSERYRLQRFGLDLNNREANYIVDFKLLPKYAYIEGTLVLPNGATAPNEFNIQLTGLDTAYCCYDFWLVPFQQSISFPAGASEVSFRFQIDMSRINSTARHGEFVFGYRCLSDTCEQLGLVNDVVIANGTRPLSHKFFGFSSVNLDNFTLFYEDESFIFQLPEPVTLLGNLNQPIKLVQNSKEKPFDTQITGKIVIEENQYGIMCQSYINENPQPIDFSSKETCYNPYYLASIVTLSETPFIIDAGDTETLIDIYPQESDQILPNDYSYEYQRIRVVCDTGCESPKLKNSGYYREQSKYLMAKSANGARQFLLTDDFSSEPIIISLENLVLPNFDLLLEEEEELDQQSH